MSEQSGEKTFEATAKRKQDAAKKGDVVRSKEMATAGAILIGACWLMIAGPWVLEGLAGAMRTSFVWDRHLIEDFSPGAVLKLALLSALPPVLILGAMVIVISLIAQLGFGEGRWVGKNLMPKASRINPASGLKRMFGPTGWIEMAKGLAKVTLLGTIAYVWGRGRIEGLIGLGRGDLAAQLTYGWHALITLLFALSAGLMIIAMIDMPVQWIRRNARLKMTNQEIRDEHKDAEGSPERKAAIRNRQRQIAMGGLAPAMREAQFVITNPSHFSVALAYDPAKASAPVLVAKGRGEKALAMRELAAEFGLPVLEYPVLARSVYFTTRERQVIREDLYVAVASILAFVLSLKRGEKPARPQVDVPVTIRFDTEGRPDPAVKT